jgi:hypothetical protein
VPWRTRARENHPDLDDVMETLDAIYIILVLIAEELKPGSTSGPSTQILLTPGTPS